MNRFGSRLNLCCSAAARLGLAGLLVAGITGCNDDGKDGPAPASSTAAAAPAQPAPRPQALIQAKQELQAGRAADAQQRLEPFLKEEPKGAYHAEAEYLLGQALASQNDFEKGKVHLELAIDETEDRDVKAFAMLARTNCNLEMKHYHLASRQYHWLETMYRDVKGLPQDEIMYKLGLSVKRAGFPDSANYWFNRVVELYATGPYADAAKRENTRFTPPDPNVKPLIYSLEVINYDDEKHAQADAEALRAKGFRDVEVIATTRNSIPVWEVHVGKFYNKNDAIRAKTDAELAGLPATIRPAALEPMK